MNVKRTQGEGLWRRGKPLTESDRELLQIVIELAGRLGYTPVKRECAQSARIKARFRSWNDVLFACGLPSPNSPEQTELRKRKQKANF